MAKSDNSSKIGRWAFVIGALIAIAAGLLGSMSTAVVSTLVILGLIVGLLNVTGKETQMFLLAGVSLVIVTSMGAANLAAVPVVGTYIVGIFGGLMTFVVPAVIIVALKAVMALAADE